MALNFEPLILTDANFSTNKDKFQHHPVRVSHIKKLNDAFKSREISIKYVFSGLETYFINKKQYDITNGKYLITNARTEKSELSINHSQITNGLCIDLDRPYLTDILHSIYHPDSIDDFDQSERFFFSEDLFENASVAGNHLDGLFKKTLNAVYHADPASHDFTNDIALALINDQKELIKNYYRIPAIKTSTRKELYVRLLKAKALMCDAVTQNVSVKEIAREVALSEFRFFHLFKQAFGLSPYNYLLTAKINKSIELKKTNQFTWTQIAYMLGFSDVAAFSKQFKKFKKCSPRELRG